MCYSRVAFRWKRNFRAGSNMSESLRFEDENNELEREPSGLRIFICASKISASFRCKP